MLGSVGLLGFAGSARAFSLQSCNAAAQGETTCGQFQDHYRLHQQLLADLKRKLEAQHLSLAQEQAVLARAVCPVCGGLLLGKERSAY